MNNFFFLNEELQFPPVEESTREGIVAIGGDLSLERLLLAYRSGIFPWYSEGEPILWWSPDPRFVLFPEKLRINKSLKKFLKKNPYHVTYDTCFEEVISYCGDLRRHDGTWITPEMKYAYVVLHQEGYAHSVEVWSGKKLAGGLYGVSLGRCFFGESMFSLMDNASKTALVFLTEALMQRDFIMIDCQVYTPHLASMGAVEVNRNSYLDLLSKGLAYPHVKGNWSNCLI